MELEFSNRLVALLKHIEKKGFVSKDTRPFLSNFRFFNYVWMARDAGWIQENGNVSDDIHQKRWVLSENGKKVMKHLHDIEKLTGVEKNESQSDNS